jgi:hypothetical protein
MSPLHAQVGTPSFLVTLNAYQNSFLPLGSPAIQLASKDVGIPRVKPQHKLYQHRDSLGHHHDHQEWERETTFSIVHAVGFGKAPSAMGLENFLDILVYWKITHNPSPCLSRWKVPGP